MDVAEIEALGPALGAFLAEFDDCYGRVELRDHLRTYVSGQLSDLPRKSVEPIALAAGVPPRTLQLFLSRARWQQGMVRDRLQQLVARDHADPLAVGLVDETSHPKKGEHTPGVKRQYCGASGKTDNCAVTVHLGYAAPGGFHCLLDGDLFLPADWSADRDRCRAAGIPDDVVHRPKWRIALEMLDRARANGVVLPWLTFDEGYGRATEFLHALDDRGQHYVAEVPTTFTGWTARPPVLHRAHHPADRLGRPRSFPRLAASARPASAACDLLRCSPALTGQPWERFPRQGHDQGAGRVGGDDGPPVPEAGRPADDPPALVDRRPERARTGRGEVLRLQRPGPARRPRWCCTSRWAAGRSSGASRTPRPSWGWTTSRCGPTRV